jgi:hypothetical protein
MVKDKTDHGVPVAFIITSSGSTGVYKDVLTGLREHVGVDIQPLLGKIVSAEVRMSARRAAVGCPNMHLPHLPHCPSL